MPTTTWRVARRDIARPFGLVEFDTSTNLTTDDKIISTELTDRYTVDDHFNGQWFVTIVLDADTAATVTTGAVPANGIGTLTRRVEDYTASSGQLTIVGANLLAEDESVTCDLYNTFHPTTTSGRTIAPDRQCSRDSPRIKTTRALSLTATLSSTRCLRPYAR